MTLAMRSAWWFARWLRSDQSLIWAEKSVRTTHLGDALALCCGDGGCRRVRPVKFITAVYATCAVLACLHLTTQKTAAMHTETTLQGAAQIESLNL